MKHCFPNCCWLLPISCFHSSATTPWHATTTGTASSNSITAHHALPPPKKKRYSKWYSMKINRKLPCCTFSIFNPKFISEHKIRKFFGEAAVSSSPRELMFFTKLWYHRFLQMTVTAKRKVKMVQLHRRNCSESRQRGRRVSYSQNEASSQSPRTAGLPSRLRAAAHPNAAGEWS